MILTLSRDHQGSSRKMTSNRRRGKMIRRNRQSKCNNSLLLYYNFLSSRRFTVSFFFIQFRLITARTTQINLPLHSILRQHGSPHASSSFVWGTRRCDNSGSAPSRDAQWAIFTNRAGWGGQPHTIISLMKPSTRRLS